jgi:hypothetical protein
MRSIVSLLSPDTTLLYIAPDGIEAVRLSGRGQRLSQVRQVQAEVQAVDGWQGLLRAWEPVLADFRPQALRVVLSDGLVRTSVLPWNGTLRNRAEDLAHAAMVFDDVHGMGSSADWYLAFSGEAPGRSRLAVAMPQALHALLLASGAAMGAPVRSLSCGFCAVAQAYRRALGPQGWLVNVESSRVTVGSWGPGGWATLSSVGAQLSEPHDLAEHLQQEMAMAGVELASSEAQPHVVAVHAPLWSDAPISDITGVRFKRLRGLEPAFAMLGRVI